MKSSRGKGRLVPNFCESTSPDNPNAEVFGELLEQVNCMFQKMIVNRQSFNATEEMHIASEDCFKFQEQIQCMERINGDLEAQIACLLAELQRITACLEEETARRKQLELCVTELKLEIDALDAELCMITAERDKLIRQLEEMCRAQESLQRQIEGLCDEKEELKQRFTSQQMPTSVGGVNNYQSALADCCSNIDELTRRIGCLNAEINKLQREKEDLIRERDELAAKLECMKRKYETEKCLSDEIIQKLKEQVRCLEKQQLESCRKFEKIIKDHHDELDRVEGERVKFRNLYQEEQWRREELERKLKECEERKKREKEGQEGSGAGGKGGSSGGPPSAPTSDRGGGSNPTNYSSYDQTCYDCDKYSEEINRLVQEKTTFENTRQCLEAQILTVTTQNANLSKELKQLYEKIQGLQTMSLEKDENNNCFLQELSEKSEKAKQELEHEISQLQTQLESTQASKKEKETEAQDLRERITVIEHDAICKSESLRAESSQIRFRLNAVDEERQMLQNKADSLEDQLSQMKTNFSTEKHQLAEQLAKTKKEILTLESSNSAHKEQNDDYLQEIKKLKEKYDKQLKEMQRKHATDLERKLAKQEHDFKKEITSLKQKSLEPPPAPPIKKVASVSSSQNTVAPDLNDNFQQVDDDVTIPTLINAKRSLQHDIKKLKKMVNERDEHIAALQTSINEMRKQYSDQYKQLRMQKIQMEGVQSVLERQEVQLQMDRENLERDIIQFGQDQKNFEIEKMKHQDYLKRTEKERQTLEHLSIMKDKIENEVLMLKEAISKQFVDKSDLQKLKLNYELQLADLQNKFESQLEMNRQLAEINEQLGKQFIDRDLINQMRDSNEEILRKELQAVLTGSKSDVENLRKIINERDEEVGSLRKLVSLLKNKYASAAQKNEELVKQVHYLANSSQENFSQGEEEEEQNNN